MKSKEGKPGAYPDKSSRAVPMTLMFIVLCGFSFYLGGIFFSEKNKFTTKIAVQSAQSRKDTAVSPLQIKPLTFPECGIDYQDYTPCTDPKVLNDTFLPAYQTVFCSMCIIIW